MVKKKFLLVLGLIMGVGFFLRLQPIITTSLWDDEAISVNLAKNTLLADFLWQSNSYWDHIHPSLYYLILRGVLAISDHDYVLRGFSVIFYPLSFFTLLKLLRKESPLVQSVSVALYSFHPLVVKLEYQVRMYSIALFANIAASFFILKYEKSGHKQDLFLSVMTLTLAFYLDYLTIWLIVGTIFYLIWLALKKKLTEFKRVFVVLGLSFFTCLFQISILFKDIVENRFHPGSVTTLSDFPFIQNQFLSIIGFNHQLNNFWGLIAVIYLISTVVTTKHSFWKMICVFPIVIVMALSVFVTPLFLARNLVVCTIAYICCLGISVKTKTPLKLFFVTGLLALYLINSFQMSGFDYSRKSDFVLSEIKSQEMNVILVGQNEFEPFLSHYFSKYEIPEEKYYRPQKPEEVVKVSNQKIKVLIWPSCDSNARCTSIFKAVENVCLSNTCDLELF